MPDPDDIWTEALQEAYASSPTEEVILSTLEIRHTSFPTVAIRVVADYGTSQIVEGVAVDGHFFTLEDDAPAQAGQSVFFQACMFNLQIPEQKEGILPSIQIELDNVTSEIMQYLDDAIGAKAPMEVTYREYLSSDFTTPQFVLGGLNLSEVSCTLQRVTGTARFNDLVNRNFPGKLYRLNEFQGLLQ